MIVLRWQGESPLEPLHSPVAQACYPGVLVGACLPSG